MLPKPYTQQLVKAKMKPIDNIGTPTNHNIEEYNEYIFKTIKGYLDSINHSLKREEQFRHNYREYRHAPIEKPYINWEINQIYNALIELIRYNKLNEKEPADKKWATIRKIQKRANQARIEYVGATYTTDHKGRPVPKSGGVEKCQMAQKA